MSKQPYQPFLLLLAGVAVGLALASTSASATDPTSQQGVWQCESPTLDAPPKRRVEIMQALNAHMRLVAPEAPIGTTLSFHWSEVAFQGSAAIDPIICSKVSQPTLASAMTAVDEER